VWSSLGRVEATQGGLRRQWTGLDSIRDDDDRRIRFGSPGEPLTMWACWPLPRCRQQTDAAAHLMPASLP